jgi:hypothetical protein
LQERSLRLLSKIGSVTLPRNPRETGSEDQLGDKGYQTPEFGTPDNFVDLCDIVESHTKQDSLWVEELAKMTDTVPGQVQRFMEHPIRARTVLQQLNTSLVKYQMHAMDIRGIHVAPMEQHRFPWAQTCEELFISWSEYEKSHPFK